MEFRSGNKAASGVVLVDSATLAPLTSLGGGGSSLQSYALLVDATATGPAVTDIRGGKYLWNAEGTFNGATLTLQRQRQDGTWANFTPTAALTAEGILEVLIGQGASIQVLVTGGPPSAMYSNLSGVE